MQNQTATATAEIIHVEFADFGTTPFGVAIATGSTGADAIEAIKAAYPAVMRGRHIETAGKTWYVNGDKFALTDIVDDNDRFTLVGNVKGGR